MIIMYYVLKLQIIKLRI